MFHRTLLELRHQRPQFPLGILVVLIDGELQRLLEQCFRLVATAELQLQFPEENPRHHPVGFFGDAKLVMRDGGFALVVRVERLRETETKHLVLRVALHERVKLINAR